jgi:hypothetical protein
VRSYSHGACASQQGATWAPSSRTAHTGFHRKGSTVGARGKDSSWPGARTSQTHSRAPHLTTGCLNSAPGRGRIADMSGRTVLKSGSVNPNLERAHTPRPAALSRRCEVQHPAHAAETARVAPAVVFRAALTFKSYSSASLTARDALEALCIPAATCVLKKVYLRTFVDGITNPSDRGNLYCFDRRKTPPGIASIAPTYISSSAPSLKETPLRGGFPTIRLTTKPPTIFCFTFSGSGLFFSFFFYSMDFV